MHQQRTADDSEERWRKRAGPGHTLGGQPDSDGAADAAAASMWLAGWDPAAAAAWNALQPLRYLCRRALTRHCGAPAPPPDGRRAALLDQGRAALGAGRPPPRRLVNAMLRPSPRCHEPGPQAKVTESQP